MSTDIAFLRINLLESFTNLLSVVSEFCTAVRHDGRQPAWVSRTEQEIQNQVDMRSKAVQLYQALWYEDGQDGRETLTCPGIVGASPNVMAAAATCNAAKDNFKAAVLALKSLHKTDANSLMTELYRRDEAVAAVMKRMGAARLNLKQAYRHIPLLDKRPLKIGFTWSKQGRTIQRTSVAEAWRLLNRRRETPQRQMERQRLSSIPDSEVLARVRSVCPHLRANIVLANSNGGVKRRLMQAPLPLLIPLSPGEKLPEFVPIPPEPQGGLRLQRSDIRIEDEVFLPSLHAYRYRARFR
jgi:hypothetical protein